jgi:hypothetical protein
MTPTLDHHDRTMHTRFAGSCIACGSRTNPGIDYAAARSNVWEAWCERCATDPVAALRGVIGRLGTLPVDPEALPSQSEVTEAVQSGNVVRMVLRLIDTAKAATPAAAPTVRPNRYAGACQKCGATVPENAGRIERGPSGKWLTYHLPGACPEQAPGAVDLSTLPGIDSTYGAFFAVPNGDTRLKVRVKRPASGKWAGTIFVDDGAAYGQRTAYGRQVPGAKYSGKLTEELRAIVADPQGARHRYGQITGQCCFCRLPLERSESVRHGYGPTCADNNNLPFDHAAYAAEGKAS